MQTKNNMLRKLGGLGKIVNVDETMLNYKCKSHRGRSTLNRTDALCIVECDVVTGHIDKVWAQVIPNKSASTIIPIIIAHVLEHSVIHTDEHKSYLSLCMNNFSHFTV